jgi:hypothetical protein
MNEKVNDLRLNSIDGLASAIEKMVKGKQDKPSPMMTAAFGGVLDLLDEHGGYDAGISRAVDKVRDALNIPRKPKQETLAP